MPRELYKKKVKTTRPEDGTTATAFQEGVQEASGEQSVVEEQLPAEGMQVHPVVETVEAVDVVLPTRPVSLAELPLDAIFPSRAQARGEENLTPESLEGLVSSMQEHGILTRIRVRPIVDDDEHFEIVFGERRWRAAGLAGFTHYPVEIATYNDDELEEVGLIENVQRKDLTPLEEAKKYQRLLALQDADGEPRYSYRKLAQRLGKDKGYIELRLAVLRSPEDVQQLLRDEPDTPVRSVYEVSKVKDPEKREEIITDIREGKVKGVEEVKVRVREATGRAPQGASKASAVLSSPQSQQETQEPAMVLTVEEVEQPTATATPSLEVINGSSDSTQALALFEQQLQKDNDAFLSSIHRLTADTEVMTQAQREVLLLYVDRWGKALMDLKSHAYARNN